MKYMLSCLLLLAVSCGRDSVAPQPVYTGPCTIHANYFAQNPDGTWGTISINWHIDPCPDELTISNDSTGDTQHLYGHRRP